MDGHHLILGTTIDLITGERIADTHDERYRQKIASYLLESCGYAREEIRPRCPLIVAAGDRKGRLWVDFLVEIHDCIGMLIKYGPGSLVTRHRPALAMSRLMAPYQIPVVVVTNGETADVLDGLTGREIASGFDAIPTRQALRNHLQREALVPVSPQRSEMEARIVYAFEIDGGCPCDDTACRIA